MNFKKDLEFGEYYEMKLLEHLDYDLSVKKDGNFKDYDIEIYKDNIKTTYEVKADRMAYNTNNIAIEYECFNKPSGISTTKADYWAIFEIIPKDDYNLYIIPTKDIKQLINIKEYFRYVKGGDFNKSKMFLFNKNIFHKYLQNKLNIE